MSIRIRQRLSIINDMIWNFFMSDLIKISSGSLAEGIDLPGSDIDVMYLNNNVDIIKNLRSIIIPIQHTTLVMELDNDHRGFTRLRLIADVKDSDLVKSACCESTTNGVYLSVTLFFDNIKEKCPGIQICYNGPSISDTGQNFDFAICLRCKSLPYSAILWVMSHRNHWPPNFVIDKITKYGCLLVPIGPRTIADSKLLWRLSCSMADKITCAFI